MKKLTSTGILFILLNLSYTAIAQNASYYGNQGVVKGTNCSAFGFEALKMNTLGKYNTALGYQSLYNNKGDNNTGIGYQAFYNNTGTNNVGIGDKALYNNQGSANTAIGNGTLYANTTGRNNTAIGNYTLFKNTLGESNTAIGGSALNENTLGTHNTAVGNLSLGNTDIGKYNTAIGVSALYYNTTGEYNTAIGAHALSYNLTGNYNTAIGYGAGVSEGLSNLINTIAIGKDARVTASNKVVIGNSSIISIGGYANWSKLSDARFKKNVQQDVVGLDFILKLKPVTYNTDVTKLNTFLGVKEEGQDSQAIREKEAIRYTGFLAQEVEKAAQAVNYNFSGVNKPANEKDHYSISYADFVVPLVKAVQEQQSMIEQQQKQIDELKKLVTTLAALSANSTSTKDANEAIKLYPNPTSGVFTINTNQVDNGVIEIHDASGNKLQTVLLVSNTFDYLLDLSKYKKGTYMVSLISKDKKVTSKIVVE